ncbi:MAG: DNA-directed RNA polymerase subunit beta [Planctomycetota bacterium]|nr:MAG: DNA-directed RNA polymerase subunit beta [Planctomycetota bacterium]
MYRVRSQAVELPGQLETINYGLYRPVVDIPNLVELQTKSYSDFLQIDVAPDKRESIGLQALLEEIFPIESYDKEIRLEFLGYELSQPRYDPDECRKLRLTYGYPFKVHVRRVGGSTTVEEEVYLGEIPVMIGGGEFIVNGSERVIVSQLHRSPGVDFSVEVVTGDRELHSCWIIPERGSWIEVSVGKKETVQVRIDQSGKFSAMTLLRAMDPRFSTDRDILREFYAENTKVIKRKKSEPDQRFADRLNKTIAVGDIVNLSSGEIIVPSGEEISDEAALHIAEQEIAQVEVIVEPEDRLIINSLKEDTTTVHEEALMKIYQRLRPGNPPNADKARDLFNEKFFDATRYRLGRVGRFRLNRKFGQHVGEEQMTLEPSDFVNAIQYLLKLRAGTGELDDIDHLGNRRVRTILELAGEEFRKGLLKLRRTAQERMTLESNDVGEGVTPRNLINAKTFSSAIDFFFARGELSQVVDQTNPLSQLAHERRLSALGPGGLNRKRAGFEVRDVQTSHYGRLCPIETPEGTNIGLISSLSLFAGVDDYGFLVCPYRKVRKGKVTDEVEWLRADEEQEHVIVPADAEIDDKGRLVGERVLGRKAGEPETVGVDEVSYMDISPMQVVGVSASLIPFLEHDDANRALMGSNMQRQAVPLLTPELPLVGTGMEDIVARNSGMVVRARRNGQVKFADATQIMVDDEKYELRKFRRLNEKTCLNQKPIVKEGDKVKVGDILADGPATQNGVLALGKNLLVAFMTWDGYNFEDAILLSERLVKDDVYTSIHIDEFEIEIRETKLGREEFTRDIPNVSEKALAHLDESGIVQVGTRVRAGDILVGKVAPKSKSELTPEEKLLHAIFGRAGEDVKNSSLEVPTGVEGIVIDAQKFSRKVNLTEAEREANLQEIKQAEMDFMQQFRDSMASMLEAANKVFNEPVCDDEGEPLEIPAAVRYADLKRVQDFITKHAMESGDKKIESRIQELVREYSDRIKAREADRNKRVNRLSRGDELPQGVLEMVKVFVASKRKISVGDKMAGRHGNKGVISLILPEEDMPFLEDGTPVDIVLNPLGVPSRMNVGQILETHLGWAASKLGFRAVTPVFDGASEAEIEDALRRAGLPEEGKTVLHDGRSGEPLEQKVTVGYIYMLKLHHLVDDKVHARATGPYSLITQQPLGGKARFGGQRFGEMEVWALEAYGAAHILQELLTVKSDDVDGRTKIYEAMVKGENILEPGTPVSFGVLCHELRGLGLDIDLERKGSPEALLG